MLPSSGIQAYKTAYETIEYEDMAQDLWVVFLEKTFSL